MTLVAAGPDGLALGEDRLAAEIGGKVDILINTAEVHRTQGIASRKRRGGGAGGDGRQLLRACCASRRSSVPSCGRRGADGQSSATAWVNLLSIYALSNYPPHGTFSASKAAALVVVAVLARRDAARAACGSSMYSPVRSTMSGIRRCRRPKLSPDALARAIVKALQDGVEDVYPGDVAQEWLARWHESPKTLEREVSI